VTLLGLAILVALERHSEARDWERNAHASLKLVEDLERQCDLWIERACRDIKLARDFATDLDALRCDVANDLATHTRATPTELQVALQHHRYPHVKEAATATLNGGVLADHLPTQEVTDAG
jgi:hypothetical protein